MATNSSFLVDASALTFEEDGDISRSWVHALNLGSYTHPIYGTIDVTTERVKNFMDSVKNKVRGTVEPSINYHHNNEDVAAGWVKDADQRSDGLWVLVEWVKEAAQAIKDKKYRYFSSEFVDEWTNPETKVTHKDVILGGALTNRPFMKNLVPLNLSDSTIDLAFELVEAITGKDKDSLKGGKDVELSDADITKIVDGLATKLKESKPEPTPTPATPSLMEMPEIKALAEENPIVKGLVEIVERQQKALAGKETNLKEAEIAAKLAEFDRTKIVLTPVAKELTQKLAMGMSGEQNDDFFKLLSEMKKGSSFLVELGERAGATVNYGTPKSSVKQFEELSASLKRDRKLSDADAYEAAASENPELYRRYRNELMSEVK